MVATVIRLGLAAYRTVLACAPLIATVAGSGAGRASSFAHTIVATGTFLSDNWVRAHLLPLVRSSACARLVVVADQPSVRHAGLRYRCPPSWLRAVLGRIGARSAVFLWTAWRERPGFTVGYHLLPNGLLALLAARLTGARAIYQCCGGPGELDGGGPAMMENGVFRRVERADARIAAQLRAIVRAFDVIVTRGDDATAFFRGLGVRGRVLAIPGGVDTNVYVAAGQGREFDLITVGRLARIKRIDVFLETVAHLRRRHPRLRAAVIGDGPLAHELRAYARALDIDACVLFAGARDDVASWLARAKVFLLTSDSEGLSIALAEAMMAGLPSVVSDVGELASLVIDGETGFRVGRGRPEAFAERASELLADEARWSAFSGRARQRALALCAVEQVSDRWSTVLTSPARGERRSRAAGERTA
jgi:glycosyltransferase involved in cell wall biosynthesis